MANTSLEIAKILCAFIYESFKPNDNDTEDAANTRKPILLGCVTILISALLFSIFYGPSLIKKGSGNETSVYKAKTQTLETENSALRVRVMHLTKELAAVEANHNNERIQREGAVKERDALRMDLSVCTSSLDDASDTLKYNEELNNTLTSKVNKLALENEELQERKRRIWDAIRRLNQ